VGHVHHRAPARILNNLFSAGPSPQLHTRPNIAYSHVALILARVYQRTLVRSFQFPSRGSGDRLESLALLDAGLIIAREIVDPLCTKQRAGDDAPFFFIQFFTILMGRT
jgi:hypothetical protein